MRGALLDVRPLRHSPDFRRLWIGTSLSALGSQFTVFAVMLQVWQLTHSPTWTGAIGLAHGVPMILFSLYGGALADAVDRRPLVLVASTGQLLTALLLAVQAFAGVDSPLLVLCLVLVQTSFSAVAAPARRTFVPRLLPPELVPAGLALTMASFQGAMLLGPTLAGLIAAGWGLPACYAFDALTFAASMYGVFRLPSLAPEPSHEPPASAVRRIAAGLAFAGRTPVVRGVLVTDLAATVLAMPVALFPVVNAERFDGSPRTLGLFLTSLAVGGIGATLLSGAVTRRTRPGVVMVVAASVWGVALAAFGLVDGLPLTVATLAVAGAADSISVVSRASVLQLSTPEALRGRVSALEGLVGVAGPDLGNLRGGLVAGWTSPAASLVSGGLLCTLVVGAVAVTSPAVRRFERELVPEDARKPIERPGASPGTPLRRRASGSRCTPRRRRRRRSPGRAR